MLDLDLIINAPPVQNLIGKLGSKLQRFIVCLIIYGDEMSLSRVAKYAGYTASYGSNLKGRHAALIATVTPAVEAVAAAERARLAADSAYAAATSEALKQQGIALREIQSSADDVDQKIVRALARGEDPRPIVAADLGYGDIGTLDDTERHELAAELKRRKSRDGFDALLQAERRHQVQGFIQTEAGQRYVESISGAAKTLGSADDMRANMIFILYEQLGAEVSELMSWSGGDLSPGLARRIKRIKYGATESGTYLAEVELVTDLDLITRIAAILPQQVEHTGANGGPLAIVGAIGHYDGPGGVVDAELLDEAALGLMGTVPAREAADPDKISKAQLKVVYGSWRVDPESAEIAETFGDLIDNWELAATKYLTRPI